MPHHIVIVEDEPVTQARLQSYFTQEGYTVSVTASGAGLREIMQNQPVDLILLDINLPDENGLMLTRALRERSTVGIILVTGRSDRIDRIVGLEMGADDYLPKPFSVQELIARVKALFRRQEAMGQNIRLEGGLIRCHGLHIDPLAREVRLCGELIDLTPREFDLLYWFARHPGEVFSRLSLLDNVWGYQHEGYEHTVNTHINRLRTKIEHDAAEPEIILTVWGKGYKFAVDKTEPHS